MEARGEMIMSKKKRRCMKCGKKFEQAESESTEGLCPKCRKEFGKWRALEDRLVDRFNSGEGWKPYP